MKRMLIHVESSEELSKLNDRLIKAAMPVEELRSCFKITQVSYKTRQISAKKRRLHGVNEHFEPIFNAVLCQLKDLKQLLRGLRLLRNPAEGRLPPWD
jgi:hypothetical protein